MGVSGFLVGVVIFVLCGIALLIGVVGLNESRLVNDCYSVGGSPVQGSSLNGTPVVCLDSSAVLSD